MTKNEQAIANLKKLKSVHNGSFGADIDTAIKALKQQPCEDCVSRADALRVAKNEYLRGWHKALCKALDEEHSIHCEEGNFKVIQEETIIGLGLSMNCALGKDVESYMSAIPSVTPAQRWIPVSKEMPDEELPEDFQRVLITVVNYAGDKVVRAACYINPRRMFRVEGSSNLWEVGEKGLLAWMPLPEPYKAGSEVQE